ncbi:hypothetical protein [Shimia ponticola]|uniref:hypothetical protein n=1 Tax=Shimia ponticola TaxID=2582893 RepID=UPI0011BDD10E|nr:hypothetical protein [Shimia ponticola]
MTFKVAPDVRALIVGESEIEVMDLGDYLMSLGWAAPDTAMSSKAAAELLNTAKTPYALAIVGLSQAVPGTMQLLRDCVAFGTSIIALNGVASSSIKARIVTVARPYHDVHLNAALMELNLWDYGD